MLAGLQRLKSKGVDPEHIFDLGAHRGWWTDVCLQVYPNAKYYLFEGSVYSELDRFAARPGMKVYQNIILAEEEREVKWYHALNGTGDSFLKERTGYYNNCKVTKRETRTLNSSIDASAMRNILIKIDCQGAEIPILKGATYLVENTDFILLEMPFFGQYNENVPNFLEHVQYMDSIGFIPYDTYETHYIDNLLLQIDILFINKKHPLNDLIQNTIANMR
jgi:FkbM family methyltransferase